MHLDRALIVVRQRSKGDGSYPDFDIRQMEGSLKYTGMVENIDMLYSQDYPTHNTGYGTGRIFDHVVCDWCERKKPQIVLVCLQGGQPALPTTEALSRITHQLNIPTVLFWFDIHANSYVKLLDKYSDSVTLNLIGGADASSHKPLKATNYIYSSLAYDESYFDIPEVERDIDIGFLGVVKGNRGDFIDGLRENGIDTLISGGQMTKKWMSFEEYCKLTSRFKIALSFSAVDGQPSHQLETWLRSLIKHPGNVLNWKQLSSALQPVTPPSRFMIRSRVFEMMWLRTFVLEEDNPITSQFFEPYVDYVPYTTLEDLVKKVKYYLENEEERDRIRMHGRATVEKYYNARAYFEKIFKAVGI